MVMSIDQSLSCSGVTIWDDNEYMVYSTCIKTPPKEEVILRIRSIISDLIYFIQQYSIDTVVIESLPYGVSSTSVRPLAGLHLCIQNMCIDLNIEFQEMNVSAVKKNFTGKGSAKKEDMIEELKTSYKTHYDLFIENGYKKTTGLADLTDSVAIYHMYKKDIR